MYSINIFCLLLSVLVWDSSPSFARSAQDEKIINQKRDESRRRRDNLTDQRDRGHTPKRGLNIYNNSDYCCMTKLGSVEQSLTLAAEYNRVFNDSKLNPEQKIRCDSQSLEEIDWLLKDALVVEINAERLCSMTRTRAKEYLTLYTRVHRDDIDFILLQFQD